MSRKSRILVGALVLLVPFLSREARAAGAWAGQDLYHVPMSWCIVQGSPAQASPNVAGDTVTDDLIWRRHERPTDFIYVNQAGITFRSAINDAWTVLDFPIIADPDTTLATQGDMRGEDVNVAGTEFNQMLNDCDAAWAAMGRAGIGITAVNAGLFHDGTGTYVGVIGWGGCVEDVGNPGFCVSPWDGQIAVVDNHYLFPTVPDRTFPGTSLQFVLTDPMDQLVGHELGHALSLPHRSSATALMNPNPVDNVGGDSQSDNVALNSTEVTAVRGKAAVLNGVEIDPPQQILKGDVVASLQVDQVREASLPPHLDLAAVRVALDTRRREATLGQRLFGLLPKKGRQRHWFLVDTDGSESGAGAEMLRRIGAPETPFRGADLVICAEVRGRRVTGTAWRLEYGKLVRLTDRRLKFRLLVLVMHPHYAEVKGQPPIRPTRDGFPVYNVVAVTLPDSVAGLELGRPFRVHASTAQRKGRSLDELRARQPESGVEFVLEHPSFPHCFPQGDAAPGERVKVVLEKLKPNMGIHGLLGPRLVFRGETDESGGGTIDFEIPKDTTPGLHLVTIGNDRTALTADCVVNVRPQ